MKDEAAVKAEIVRLTASRDQALADNKMWVYDTVVGKLHALEWVLGINQ